MGFGRIAKVQIKPLVKTTVSWDSSAIFYPIGKPEITGLLIEIAPGAETKWHLHPVPSFAYILEGNLEVTLKDGRRNNLKAGDVLVEVMNTAHNGRNIGTTPVKLVVFYAGVVGQPLTVKRESITAIRP